jgi:hypothetical protein
MAPSRFVLFLGNKEPQSAADRLKASGIRYVRKRLDSRPPNWETILTLLADQNLICTVGRLSTAVFDKIASAEYAEVAPAVLKQMARTPHILFVHEAVLTGEQPSRYDADDEQEENDGGFYAYLRRDGYFRSPSDDVRAAVARFFDDLHVNLVPYTTNAEMGVMADQFVADNERDLLFRVYVPSGRLYAAEADKLLKLFRDWLGKVGSQGVRQDGYETPSGHMYEFYGDGRPRSQDLSQEFRDFSDFLDLCMDDPGSAQSHLTSLGLSPATSAGLVSRYGKEARRLLLDLKHEREQRVLVLRQGLDSDVLETTISNGEISTETIDRLVNDLVPTPGLQLAVLLTAGAGGSTPINVQINQQIINTVEGSVLQNIRGTADLGPDAKQLLELIERFGGDDTNTLTSALFELEDPDAAKPVRVGAKQRLKGFLIRLGGVAQDVAITALTKYLETKLGV